jgi:hypothetical protein
MLKEKIIQVTQPLLQQETLIELNKLKVFVDASLKECLTQNFDDEKQKSKYLLESLYQIRDFVISRAVENSVRQSLILEFQKIESEIELGNELQQQEEKQLEIQEEKSEQNLKENNFEL